MGLVWMMGAAAAALWTYLEIKRMSTALAALQGEVAENSDVIGSAITLLNGIGQALRDALAANDPAALEALSAQLDAQTNDLAAAVAANTPAPVVEPEPAPEPVVE